MEEKQFVTVVCMIGLRSNERTIRIDISKTEGGIAYLSLEMTPKDFAEAVCSHISRPAVAFK